MVKYLALSTILDLIAIDFPQIAFPISNSALSRLGNAVYMSVIRITAYRTRIDVQLDFVLHPYESHP